MLIRCRPPLPDSTDVQQEVYDYSHFSAATCVLFDDEEVRRWNAEQNAIQWPGEYSLSPDSSFPHFSHLGIGAHAGMPNI